MSLLPYLVRLVSEQDLPAADAETAMRSILRGEASQAQIAAFLIAPLLIVIPMSFSDSTLMQFPPPRLSLRWYRAYFGDRAANRGSMCKLSSGGS